MKDGLEISTVGQEKRCDEMATVNVAKGGVYGAKTTILAQNRNQSMNERRALFFSGWRNKTRYLKTGEERSALLSNGRQEVRTQTRRREDESSALERSRRAFERMIRGISEAQWFFPFAAMTRRDEIPLCARML